MTYLRNHAALQMARWLLPINAAITALGLCAAPGESLAQAPGDSRCLSCHGQEQITADSDEDLRLKVVVPEGQTIPPRADKRGLFVTRASLAKSTHAGVACVSCHPDADSLPHAARLTRTDCTTCHTAEAADYQASAHAAAAAQGAANAPKCWDCHGTHDIRRKLDTASKAYPLNVIKVCGECHSSHHPPHDGAQWVGSYLDSVHGRAVTQAGLIVAATCADCHGSHRVLPSANKESSVHRSAIPQTCGRCHAGINEVFSGSVHAEAARRQATQPAGKVAAMRQPPVCSDCHASHAITRHDTEQFERDIVDECGSCHQDLYETYRESYHGQVQKLGSDRAARCSDCHGTHNIRSPDDPLSTLAAGRRADACAQCHRGLKDASAAARSRFVEYRPHANFRDRRKDPVLFYIWLYFIILMSLTFAFWGLHSIAWFVRGTINRVRHGPAHRPAQGRMVRRFGAWHRWTHAFVIVSFMGLTITGLPLKFSDQPWARPLMAMVGGPHTAGLLHRCFAVLVLVYLVMHVIHLVRGVGPDEWRRGPRALLQKTLGPHSMLPTKRDWFEFCQMVRWFLGTGPKPRFDRWTYWEKFDYWADAVGTFIIGGSGLLLWFPTFFAAWLSGYWFNVATVVHGYEALLAVGFIFTIHFFNAHLRWEKFPVDDVIFTGRVSEEEFREERPAQYERLVQEARLEELIVAPAPRRLHVLARVVAVISLVVGSLLVVLIVLAGLL